MSRKRADPAQQELALAQADATREQMAIQRDMWTRALDLQEQDSLRSEEQYQFNRGLQEEASARDRFFFDRYKNTTQRQEDAFFKAVDEYDTESNRQQIARRGIADVQEGMGRARRDSMDMLRRRGVNVGSARAMSAMTGLDVAQASAEASAFNTAMEAARREGMALRQTAAGLGNPLGASSGFMNASSGFGGTAMDFSSRGLNWATGQAGQAGQMAQGYGANANAAFNSVAANTQKFDWGKAIVGGMGAYAKSGGNPWAAGLGALGGGMGG